ncbi:hypothetical protein L6164_018516 [Bauhinia variegata]|uniref:Uncharacterized protein n=1 Tax=Bauhinia variegata TaxID=167791 RepID=A0ACB9NCP3_BAUVA|nr:hypothetical protein L6164_018516 [Bauhinia variegata]
MGKSPSGEKNNGLKKGPWTPEEDEKLMDYIQKHGPGKWRILPKNAGLRRCGKSCRLRWTNYLRPDIKRGRFSFEEEEAIIQLHSVLGNKWSTIAASLPGRTDNEIKNYWNTHIKKRLLKMGIDPVTHTPCLDLLQLSSILSSSLYNNSSPQLNYPGLLQMASWLNPNLLNLLTTLLSSQSRNPDFINTNQLLQQNQLAGISTSPPEQNQHQCPGPIMQLNSVQSFQPNQLQVPIQGSQAKLNQVSPSDTHFSYQQSTQPNLWQCNGGQLEPQPADQSATENFSLPKFNSMINSLLGNQVSQSPNSDGVTNFNLSTLLSSTTSSSSPSALNSSLTTTLVNGAAEDERDTYCSNMLMYNISNSLHDNGLL